MDFIAKHSGAGDPFASAGHAAEIGIGRFRDEIEFLRSSLTGRAKFDEPAYWRLHTEHISAYRPLPMGPRREPVPETTRIWFYLHDETRDWIQGRTQPTGPWDPQRPIPHAIDASLRLLKSVGLDPIRSAGFACDRTDLLRRYHAAAKA